MTRSGASTKSPVEELKQHSGNVHLEMKARSLEISKNNEEMFERMFPHLAVPPNVEERRRLLAGVQDDIRVDARDAPYDQPFSNGLTAGADATTGFYDMSVWSENDIGGITTESAGIGAWFLDGFTDNNFPFGIPNNKLEVDLSWQLGWDSDDGAHSYLRTMLWVWGDAEQKWVAQDSTNHPLLDDSTVITGHSHGGNQAGLSTIYTLFPSVAGGTYESFVWNICNVGSGDFGHSKMSFSATVKEMRVSHYGLN